MALIDNIVSYYEFESSSVDELGLNSGTDANMSYTSAAGKIGNGGDYGSASAITLGNPAAFRTDTFTLNFWMVRRPAASQISMIWARNDNVDTYPQFGILFFNDDTFIATTDNNAGTGEQRQIGSLTRNSFADGDMVTIIGNHPTVKCYINGVDSGTTTNFTQNFTLNVNTPLQAIGQDGEGGRYFCTDMRLDELGFWSVVKSDTDITALYNAGAGLQYPFASAAAAASSLTTLNVG